MTDRRGRSTAAGPQASLSKTGVLFISSPVQPAADTFIHALLMRHLDRSRFDVHAACTHRTRGVLTEAFEMLSAIPDLHLRPAYFGPSVTRSSRLGRALVPFALVPMAGGLASLAGYIRRNRIRLLHSTDRPRDALACVLLGKATGAKSIIHVHVGYGKWMKGSARWAMRRADALIGVSGYVARTLVDGGHAPQKTHAVLNAIDVAAWDPRIEGAPVRRELGIPPTAPVVVCIGRLFKGKGQGNLIRAVAEVRREIPDVHLLLVGEDYPLANPGGTSFESELRALAQELGLADRVIFTGFRKNVAELLAASDLLALPSTTEPFGLVYLEAMAMKRPVVALESGGAPEVIDHGKSGLLCAPGDLRGLITSLLSLLRDPALRARMGEYGRRQVETRFAPERIGVETARIYWELTKSLGDSQGRPL
jgi:glycosyltransferase involved in cell wall biosynthesis